MGLQPKSDIELEEFIYRENQGKGLKSVLEEADKQSKYAPY